MNPDNSLLNDEDVDESLWSSPAKPAHDQAQTPRATGRQPNTARSTYQEQQAREENLKQELQSVRQVNEAIEGVIQSLGKARDNMKVCNDTLKHFYVASTHVDRLSTTLSALPPVSSTPGRGSCPRRNTISG